MNRIRTDVFKGLHKRDGAPEGAFLEVSGITTADYPSMKVRPPRSRVGEWENATDVYETDGHMIVVDENKLYYDGEFKSNVGSGKKQFAEINRNLVIWPDKIIINLNSGEVKNIEAEISGSASLTRNNVITFTNTSGTGSIELDPVDTWYEEAGPVPHIVHDYSYFLRVYTHLSYTDGWVHEGARTVEAAFVGAGSYFIGSKPETRYYVTSNTPAWSMEGTVYGKITKVTTINEKTATNLVKGEDGNYYYVDEGRYGTRIEYELYDAAGIDLSKTFEPGDTLSIEGSSLLYNNKEAVTLQAVNENSLTVDANAFLRDGAYYNVAEELPEGTYRLSYNTGSQTSSISVTFQTARAIRVGEQIFATNSSGGGVSAKKAYAYDPSTQTLEELPSTSSGSFTELIASGYDGTAVQALTIKREVPDMDFICEHNNRLYGVSNNEEEKIFNTQTEKYETVQSRVLHASALGQPTRWNVFEGAATDSYAVAVAGEGDFTGIVSYSGNVIAFKEDKMYKLSGDYPAEFFLRNYTVDGVKKGCHKSMVIINEVLYYLSPYGVMSYSGGVPGLISYELGIDRYDEAVAGRDRTNYLIQMDKLYCYDTIHGLWVSEDYGEVTAIEPVNNRAYIVADGKIMMTDSGDEKVEWYATTHYMDEGTFLHKDYQAMNLDAVLSEGAEITIEYRTDEDEDWKILETVTSYHGTQWQTRTKLNEGTRKHWAFTPGIMRCDRIQLRLRGKGPCKVYAYDRVVRAQSDKP